MNRKQLDQLKDGPSPAKKLVSGGWDNNIAAATYYLVEWDAHSAKANGSIGAWVLQYQGDEEWAERQAKHYNLKIEDVESSK